jgi:hypothetical protein
MRRVERAFRYNVPFQFVRGSAPSHQDGANRWNLRIHGALSAGSLIFSTTFSTVSVKIL